MAAARREAIIIIRPPDHPGAHSFRAQSEKTARIPKASKGPPIKVPPATLEKHKSARCAPASTAAVSLPVIGPDGSPIRKSKSGRWRALSLFLVHVIILAHVLHWLSSGRTISPVEPSESMETIRQGHVNAGFIFFTLAIILTAVLGRWVCGWGCHLVAYQDLTLWLLKKLHLRPKAFRTRFLIFIPLLCALYMFVWPAVYRWAVGAEAPPLTWHVARTGFWDTFPDYGIAILTVITCGVAIVYFLGPKGFCTFACPYGAFFGIADKFSPARIRVTDACNQCGHCTAVCTSNVDVAREVKLHKMVVDPGCMKCLDCVSVCPNDALYFGLGRPSLLVRNANPARRYDLTIVEELAALLLFGAVFLAFRGLYGKIPFLMSLGVAGVFSYVYMKTAALFYRPDVTMQKFVLKAGGHVRKPGYALLSLGILLLALTAHSGICRYREYAAGKLFAELPRDYFGWQWGHDSIRLSPDDRQAAAHAYDDLAFCEKWGLCSSLENQQKLSWLELLRGNFDAAVRRTRQIAEAHPNDPQHWVTLANYEIFGGHPDEARKAFERALETEAPRRERIISKHPDEQLPASAQVFAEWGIFLASVGQTQQGQDYLEKAVQLDHESVIPWMALGGFYAGHNQFDRARKSLINAVLNGPYATAAISMLERIGREDQNFAAALKDYDAAPNEFVFRYNRAHALVRLRRYPEAIAAYRKLQEEHPDLHQISADLGAALLASDDLAGAIAEFEKLVAHYPSDSEAHAKLGFLYHQVNRPADATREYQTAIKLGGPGKELAEQGLKALQNPAP